MISWSSDGQVPTTGGPAVAASLEAPRSTQCTCLHPSVHVTPQAWALAGPWLWGWTIMDCSLFFISHSHSTHGFSLSKWVFPYLTVTSLLLKSSKSLVTVATKFGIYETLFVSGAKIRAMSKSSMFLPPWCYSLVRKIAPLRVPSSPPPPPLTSSSCV